MRITNNLLMHNNLTSYKTNMNSSYDILSQLNSTLKIQNSYQDVNIFSNSMRLEYEIQTLAQIKDTAIKAENFTNNSDNAFNDFIDTLEQFKDKMIQAANSGSMSATSREAIANDLEGLKTTLLSIANTSINGTFLFSGTLTGTKPFDQFGNYYGNNLNLNALIGSQLEIPYNITGQEIFFGSDNDYNKTISTNIVMYNQTKLNPNIMGDDLHATSEKVYLTSQDSIRDMVGDTDNDTTNDPDSVFYISGVDSYGESFEKQINISSSAPISSLLEQIGVAYGNTASSKHVEVSLNDYGQIEIKDTRKGSNQLEFHMFAAVDRDADANTSGFADLKNLNSNNIDDLLRYNNVDIIEFTKTSSVANPSATAVSSREDYTKPGTYKIGYPLALSDGSYAKNDTKLQDIMGKDVTKISLDGVNTAGTGVSGIDFTVDENTTVGDLLFAIDSAFGTRTTLDDGQIVADSQRTNPSYGEAPVQINLSANSQGFSVPNGLNKERFDFSVSGNKVTGNIPQLISPSGDVASSSTKLVETSGKKSLDNEALLLNLKDMYGNDVRVDVRFSDEGSYFMVGDNPEPYYILNANGEPTKSNDVTYQQLNDIMSMTLTNNLPVVPYPDPIINPDGSEDYTEAKANYNEAIRTANRSVEVNLNSKGEIEITDKTKANTNISVSMYDANANKFGETSAFNFMSSKSTIIDAPQLDVLKDLDLMIEAVRTGQYSADASMNPDNPGVQNGLTRLYHIIDHFTKLQTQIGSNSNTLAQAQVRAESLTVNLTTIKTDIIGVDIAEAYLTLNQITTSYKASLSAITQINQLSLLNYM